MKKKLISILLVLVMPMLVLCGCGNAEKKYNEESMFIVVEHLDISGTCICYVLVHKETRVMYMTQYEGGMVVMLNADGSPMLYEGEL
jgi:hypothetical protein